MGLGRGEGEDNIQKGDQEGSHDIESDIEKVRQKEVQRNRSNLNYLFK